MRQNRLEGQLSPGQIQVCGVGLGNYLKKIAQDMGEIKGEKCGSFIR